MAITISSQLQAAFDDPEGNAVVFITFDLDEGTFGFWTGIGPKDYNGITYNAGASVFDVSDIETNADGSVGDFTLSMSAAPDKGITTDVFADLASYTWHMRPVTLEIGMLDPLTGEVVGAVVIARGSMDTAPYDESPESDVIRLRCLSRSSLMAQSGNLYRNDATQTLFDDADTSLVDIGTLGGATEKDLYWGQA